MLLLLPFVSYYPAKIATPKIQLIPWLSYCTYNCFVIDRKINLLAFLIYTFRGRVSAFRILSELFLCSSAGFSALPFSVLPCFLGRLPLGQPESFQQQHELCDFLFTLIERENITSHDYQTKSLGFVLIRTPLKQSWWPGKAWVPWCNQLNTDPHPKKKKMSTS